MRLSRNFTLDELILSQTATRIGIDNTPSAEVIANLQRLCQEVLQPLRDLVGVPVIVTSGYRSPELNRAIGGAPNSAHMQGRAADIVVPSFGTPRDVIERMAAAELPYDKAILEFGRWTHVQIPLGTASPRRLIYTALRQDGHVSYLPGLVIA